jgi:hypothetical protein
MLASEVTSLLVPFSGAKTGCMPIVYMVAIDANDLRFAAVTEDERTAKPDTTV